MEGQPAGYGPGYNKAQFTGNKPIQNNVSPRYRAIYPSSATDQYFNFVLPAEQPYVAGGIAAFPMYAESDELSFSFKNLCGIIQINLKGEKSVSSISLADKGSEGSLTAQKVLTYVLGETLKLLHPYMPFITEEIYQALPHAEGSFLMLEKYPGRSDDLMFPSEAADVERMIEVIRGIRGRRAEMNVPPKTRAEVFIITEEKKAFGENTHVFFERRAGATAVILADSKHEGVAICPFLQKPAANTLYTRKRLVCLVGYDGKGLAAGCRFQREFLYIFVIHHKYPGVWGEQVFKIFHTGGEYTLNY